MTSRTKIRPIASKPQRILPKEIDNTNVIYILSDQTTSAVKANCDNIVENSDDPIIEILDGGHEAVLDQHQEHPQQQQIYQIIEQTSEDFADTEDEDEYTKTITIVSEDQGAGEEIVYVTSEESVVRDAEGQVAFVQIGGPDVASEETIETSMIVEVPEDGSEIRTVSHLPTDHSYTFKKGIKPSDLDKAKTKAAMFGDGQNLNNGSYAFILPKNLPPGATITENILEMTKLPEPKRIGIGTVRENRCGKHRWLWQFMKELLFVGDPSLQWHNQREGSFFLQDHDQLAVKWECYKKMHNMKAQVWRQMRYYFGWMEENKIVRPVPDEENLYIFVERFYREKFLPYKFKPHTDIKQINKMASEMDSVDSVLSRYKEGCKEKVFCVRGCGSQFINKEACTRHESVCTYVAVISETVIS